MTAYIAADDGQPASKNDGILREALENYKACMEWESTEDQRTREDIKFANGDTRNGWQWPTKVFQARSGDGGADLPSLTINTTRVHNDLIINQLCKNGYGIKIRPTGGKASYKSAEVMEALVRRIEYISKASSHYRKVAEHQVDGSIGYILIDTDYVSERSFNQDIFLRSARDPTAVKLDPWIQEPDGSDANFGFVVERMQRKMFNRKYPEWKDKVGTAPLDSSFADWVTDKEIMLVKYYRKLGRDDTLVAWTDENGEEHEQLASEIKDDAGKEIFKALIAQIKNGEIDGRTREVKDNEVEWFLIAGSVIIDRGKWAGKYIPICRCVGREIVIDNILDRKGHTRPMIDAQRMLNYNASSSVEAVATQTKTQWLAASRAVEGQEQWKEANVKNFAVLTWNDVDDEASPDNQQVTSPQRIEPPKPSEGHALGMQNAERQMMMISGQWQQQQGQPNPLGPESGRAINERKEQGDIATYHFAEHRGDMLRHIGVQLLDLIPKIYDTKRILHVMDEDTGALKYILHIDPDQNDVVHEVKEAQEKSEAIQIAFNPTMGEYECISDPGPDFATQRQDAENAMTLIFQRQPGLAGVCGDLYFRNSDFPVADKIADRIEKEIKATKPYLFDEGQNPQLQGLQQQLAKALQINAELMQKLAEKGLQLRGKQELRDVEAYNAETTRMAAKDKSQIDGLKLQIEAMTKLLLAPPDQRIQFEHELRMKTLDMDHEHSTLGAQHIYNLVEQANDAALNPKPSPTNGSGGGTQ